MVTVPDGFSTIVRFFRTASAISSVAVTIFRSTPSAHCSPPDARSDAHVVAGR